MADLMTAGTYLLFELFLINISSI